MHRCTMEKRSRRCLVIRHLRFNLGTFEINPSTIRDGKDSAAVHTYAGIEMKMTSLVADPEQQYGPRGYAVVSRNVDVRRHMRGKKKKDEWRTMHDEQTYKPGDSAV